MRKLLLLSLLFCKCLALIDGNLDLKQQTDLDGNYYIADNIIALATGSKIYDYDDLDTQKQHPNMDDRKNWRKKALYNNVDMERKDWEERRRNNFDNTRYLEELDVKNPGAIERLKDMEVERYRADRRYEDIPPGLRSAEAKQAPVYSDKEGGKKTVLTLNCDRDHERFEPCFAGCAAITCDNPRERLRPCYPFCEPGCICVHPYIRDDRTHKCVLPDDCSKSLKGIPDLGDEI